MNWLLLVGILLFVVAGASWAFLLGYWLGHRPSRPSLKPIRLQAWPAGEWAEGDYAEVPNPCPRCGHPQYGLPACPACSPK